MSDLVLINGDIATFSQAFGPATVITRPGKLTASGSATVNGNKVCVDGDERQVEVPGCAYFTPVFSIPGTGTLKIASLASNQLAKKTNSSGKSVLLKGGSFTAKFEVQVPAQQPPKGPGTPTPDATREYSGIGMFTSANQLFRGS